MTDAGHKASKPLDPTLPKMQFTQFALKPHIPSINNLDDINVIS